MQIRIEGCKKRTLKKARHAWGVGIGHLQLRGVGRPDGEVGQPWQVQVKGVGGLYVAEQAVFFEAPPSAEGEHSQHSFATAVSIFVRKKQK